mmetsp:Transcript_58822/g.97193  ORF Transcript_58822/g.97193 Transcript_58822/m.97193 type:complete len:220 (+) Transcript_58822:255-914(+)
MYASCMREPCAVPWSCGRQALGALEHVCEARGLNTGKWGAVREHHGRKDRASDLLRWVEAHVDRRLTTAPADVIHLAVLAFDLIPASAPVLAIRVSTPLACYSRVFGTEIDVVVTRSRWGLRCRRRSVERHKYQVFIHTTKRGVPIAPGLLTNVTVLVSAHILLAPIISLPCIWRDIRSFGAALHKEPARTEGPRRRLWYRGRRFWRGRRRSGTRRWRS